MFFKVLSNIIFLLISFFSLLQNSVFQVNKFIVMIKVSLGQLIYNGGRKKGLKIYLVSLNEEDIFKSEFFRSEFF